MKKILQINVVCGVGSTGRIVQDIGEVIEANNMESYIAYGYGSSALPNTIKIGTKLEYYVHNILSRVFCMQGRFSYFATKRFLKKVDKIKPDLIHLHNIHGNYINYRLLFKYIKSKKIPVVWTLHDCWAFTGKCTHFEAIDCNKWEKGCGKCQNLKEYPKSCFVCNTKSEYKNKKNSFQAVQNMILVTPSKWLKDKIERSFLKQFPVAVINNGIDLNQFKFKNNKIKEKFKLTDKIVLLGVASEWNDRKGLNTFLELRKSLNDTYVIILIGLNKKQMKEIPDSIIKIEKTNSIQELAEFYSMADIFINPTIEDNFPTTNLEALACGTPVITYNTGGSPESIIENCGCVVKKGDIIGLSSAIKEFKLSNKIKEACINNSKKYDKHKKFEEYINLYNSYLSKGDN